MKKTFTRIVCALLIIGFWSCKKNKTIEEEPTLSNKKSFLTFEFKKAQNAGLTEDIVCSIGNDTVYTHVLSGVQLTSLVPTFTFEGKNVTTNNVEQVSAVTANNFSLPPTYLITAEDGSVKSYKVVFEVNIPVMHINTNAVLINSKENYVNATMKITGNIPAAFSYDGKMKIRGRGNFTWGLPKKPYKIKLDVKSPLLGMNSDKTWVLMANYADKSMMRNEVAFELSRRLGLPFTPKGQFIEVILNDEYQGTYQLIEQIAVARHKVNIEEQDKKATTLPEIGGGYLLEVDGYAYAEPVNIFTPKGMPVTVHYPDAEDITAEQRKYITDYVNDFEKALFADNFTDPINGYRKYFDVDSYINYYLVNEISGNPDMFWSTYLVKTRNGKIQAGPVWDFDLGENYDNRVGDVTEKLMADAAHEPKAWINRLMQDPSFRRAMKKRWNEVKVQQVRTIPLYVDELTRKLNVTQKLNFTKWNIFNVSTHLEIAFPGSFQGEVDYLRTYLVNHIKWLDKQFQTERYN